MFPTQDRVPAEVALAYAAQADGASPPWRKDWSAGDQDTPGAGRQQAGRHTYQVLTKRPKRTSAKTTTGSSKASPKPRVNRVTKE